MEICMQKRDPILNRKTFPLHSELFVSFFNLCFISNANSFVPIHNTFFSFVMSINFPKALARMTGKLKKKINDKSREIIHKSFKSHNRLLDLAEKSEL